MKQRQMPCGYVIFVLHGVGTPALCLFIFSVGFCVARSTGMGNARTLSVGRVTVQTPALFYFLTSNA